MTSTAVPVGAAQALAWRLRRQLLDPVAGSGATGEAVRVEDVVGRLGAVQAQHEAGTELALRTRCRQSAPGDVTQALGDGRLVKTYAFRGATHLLTPQDGGVYLALRAASRMWELASWQSFYALTPADWPTLRTAVRDALAEGPVTLAELAAAIGARPRFDRLAAVLAGGGVTVVKALAWQGDLVFGPPRDGVTTFQDPAANPAWAGIPPLDEAGPRAVTAYLSAYGPASPDHLFYWLGEGLGAGRPRIRSWLAALRPTLADVVVAGRAALVLAADLDDLVTTTPSTTVRLLPGYDQWVLGPGTAEALVVPPDRRAVVTRGAAVVVVGGVVHGTWSVRGDTLTVDWFAESPPAPDSALQAESDRLANLLGRPLRVTLRTV